MILFADTNVPSSKEILTTIRLSHLTELAVHMQKVLRTENTCPVATAYLVTQLYFVVKLYGADSVS